MDEDRLTALVAVAGMAIGAAFRAEVPLSTIPPILFWVAGISVVVLLVLAIMNDALEREVLILLGVFGGSVIMGVVIVSVIKNGLPLTFP